MAADILSLPCETNHDTECLHAALAAWNIENGVQVADLWELPLDARCDIMRRAQALKIFRRKRGFMNQELRAIAKIFQLALASNLKTNKPARLPRLYLTQGKDGAVFSLWKRARTKHRTAKTLVAALVVFVALSILPAARAQTATVQTTAAVASAKSFVQEVRESMKDPNSFEVIRVLTIGQPPAADGPPAFDLSHSFRVCISFRAKNSFGGYVLGRAIADDKQGVVPIEDNGPDNAVWHSRCESVTAYKSGVDVTGQVNQGAAVTLLKR